MRGEDAKEEPICPTTTAIMAKALAMSTYDSLLCMILRVKGGLRILLFGINSRGFGAHVIAGSHRGTISACRSDGEDIATSGNRECTCLSESIRRLTDRSDDIIDGLFLATSGEILDLVVSLIEGGADKIVHTGIDDNNLLRLALLDINHLGDKRTALCHHCPTEFEMELDTLGEG